MNILTTKFRRIFVKGKSGLVGYGVTFRIGRLLVQIPIGDWPSFGTQPGYQASGQLRAETKNQKGND